MTQEEQARLNHRMGRNCAQSVYAAFAEQLGITPEEAMRRAPMPRALGGQCGAYLAGRAVLAQLKTNAVDDYERAFTGLNGEKHCSILVASHRLLHKKCNDYVGDAARMTEAALK